MSNHSFSIRDQKKINEKISKSLKAYYKDKIKKRYCVICNNEVPSDRGGKTCSLVCEKELRKLHQAHVGGRIS